MLEFYFEDPITIERLRAGPSGQFMDSFSGGLKKAGYTWWTARVFLRAADHLGRYADAQGQDIGDIDWDTLTSFDTHLPTCSCPGSSRCKTIGVIRGAKHFIDHLRDKDILKIPAVDKEEKMVAPLVLDFQSWLRTHRGLSESTVGHYSQAASQFMTDQGEDTSCCDAKTLREFVLERSKTQGHGATKTLISGLRMFMRFLASQGLCRSNLDKAIPAVAFWRLTTIPRSLQNHDVKCILDACDGSSPMGLRDRAIILLFARLGLRAGDVAQLRLDDLDWEDGSILVSGKSRRQARLPLSQEVGDAILEYLEHRPRSDAREVFLRSVAPFRAFKSGGSASQVVTRAMRRAGISASCYGAHALRHTMAFFRDHLSRHRGASQHTCDTDARSFQLLLQFASEHLRESPSNMSLEQIDSRLVEDFLVHIETVRRCTPCTRNVRLAAIKSFFRYLEYREPSALEQIRQVLAIPFKRTDSRLVSHLTSCETEALLDAPDLRHRTGIRDYAMLHLTLSAGLRVSELIGILLEDVSLNPMPSVLIRGKGRRERALPLWKTTATALRKWLAVRGRVESPELFVNAKGGSLSRWGFAQILKKHVMTAQRRCPSLQKKRVSPHVLRHTCAVVALQATQDIRKVSLWLGHSSIQTTEIYTRIDPSEKLEAINAITPQKTRKGRFRPSDDLLARLKDPFLWGVDQPSSTETTGKPATDYP